MTTHKEHSEVQQRGNKAAWQGVGGLYLQSLSPQGDICDKKMQKMISELMMVSLLWYAKYESVILCNTLSLLANIIKNTTYYIYVQSSICWLWVKNPISFKMQICLEGLSDQCKLGKINLHLINFKSNTLCKKRALQQDVKN